MKTLLIPCLLLASFVFSGCDTLIQERGPGRYGRTYDRPRGVYYDEPRQDYYYRNGRRYDRNDGGYGHNDGGYGHIDGGYGRNETVINRRVNVRNIEVDRPVYSHRSGRVVSHSTQGRNTHDSRVVRSTTTKKKKRADRKDGSR